MDEYKDIQKNIKRRRMMKQKALDEAMGTLKRKPKPKKKKKAKKKIRSIDELLGGY